MQIIDTFSGIGGFSYAGAMMGWRTVQFCEMNEFCNKILGYYWPGVPIHTDIKTLTADQIINNGLYDKNETTILTGGVPCQPWSLAGKRKGEEDDRNLWPQTIELIGSLHPDFAVLENVPGLLNWNKGVFLEQMLTSLEAEGYEVFPVILPACGVNAPHKRDRVWFVAKRINAYTTSNGISKQNRKDDRVEREGIAINEQVDGRQQSPIQFKRLDDVLQPTSDTESLRINREKKFKNGSGQSGEQRGCDIDDTCQIRQGIGYKTSPNSRLFGQEGDKQQTTGIEQCDERDVTDTSTRRMERYRRQGKGKQLQTTKSYQNNSKQSSGLGWQNFPNQSPLRGKYDGVSSTMVRNIKSEIYGTISKNYRTEDLQEVWNAFQSEDIQREIGRLYEIHTEGILLQVVQLCQTPNLAQGEFSPFGEKASEKLLRKLSKHGSFGCSPQGRELEKQFTKQFGNSLPQLSHEIALATKEIEKECASFNAWHRNESIKAYGNAIVPQIALQLFKAIEQFNEKTDPS